MSIKKILILFFFISIILSQNRIGDWNCYTSTLEIRSIAIINETVWCATGGGILMFDLQSQSFHSFTKLNGLHSTDLSIVNSSQDNLLWIGGNSPGFIQRFSLDARVS